MNRSSNITFQWGKRVWHGLYCCSFDYWTKDEETGEVEYQGKMWETLDPSLGWNEVK